MGIRVGLDEIDADEFFAMQVVEQERDHWERESRQRYRGSTAPRARAPCAS
jgi:hypothetical protein